MGRKPRLLALDEPTAALGVMESAQVEELIAGLREKGTTILLACHDIDQMFRLADRIVVLRQGRIVADLDPVSTHPDDVVALISGQPVDSTARRQLTRLHGLADRLVSADPSSSLSLIMSALGAALGTEQLCIHLVSDQDSPVPRPVAGLRRLARVHARAAGAVGAAAVRAGRRPGRPGRRDPEARHRGRRAVQRGLDRRSPTWPRETGVASSWSVPVAGPGGLSGVITVFRPEDRPAAPARAAAGHPVRRVRGQRHGAGPAAGAGHRAQPGTGDDPRDAGEPGRDRSRSSEGLVIAAQALRHGLQADEVALLTRPGGEDPRWRAFAGSAGR